jgi:hypothetical protein
MRRGTNGENIATHNAPGHCSFKNCWMPLGGDEGSLASRFAQSALPILNRGWNFDVSPEFHPSNTFSAIRKQR